MLSALFRPGYLMMHEAAIVMLLDRGSMFLGLLNELRAAIAACGLLLMGGEIGFEGFRLVFVF